MPAVSDALPTYDEANAALSEPWDKPDAPPHGWAQWKGTQLCMDLRCACGELAHLDDDFAYSVECDACKRVYLLDPHIRLVEIQPLKGKHEHCDSRTARVP